MNAMEKLSRPLGAFVFTGNRRGGRGFYFISAEREGRPNVKPILIDHYLHRFVGVVFPPILTWGINE